MSYKINFEKKIRIDHNNLHFGILFLNRNNNENSQLDKNIKL